MKKIGFFLAFLFCVPSFAELQYYSERIKMMDIEVLQQIITKDLKKLENKEDDPEPALKEALEVLLAQPDQSLAASNIFDQLRSQAGSEKTFLNVLDLLITDALASLKNHDKEKDHLREQSTYVYILNNMLVELQKNKDQEFYKGLIEKIRDADISFTDALVTHRLLNSMSRIENPSKYAATILPPKKSWWHFW
jgi:Rad3-related DNA helicase